MLVAGFDLITTELILQIKLGALTTLVAVFDLNTTELLLQKVLVDFVTILVVNCGLNIT